MTSESQIARIDPPIIYEEDSASNAYDSLVQTQNALSSVRQDIARLPSVIEHLQQNIARLQVDLACQKYDLERQQSDLARRLTQEQHLLQDVEKHQRIVKLHSYTNRLPNEILAHVFLLLVQRYDRDSVGPSGGHFYPWRTAAVCKRWRAICMGNPRLWAYIRWGEPIHSCQDSIETSLLYESRISMQLERSKTAPLFITCEILYCKCPTITSIMRAVVAHAHRWKKIDAASRLMTSIQDLRSIIPPGTAFTSLEDLVWDAHYKHLDIPYADYGPLEGLRHVELRTLKDLPLDTKIPWDHLISLEIEYWSNDIRNLLSVLPRCQALHTLNLHTIYTSDGPVVNIDIEKGSISLPHVTEAELHCNDLTSSMSYIPYIHCPSLRKLTTSISQNQDSSQVLADFVVRSQCQELLEDLTIRCINRSKTIPYISPLLRACAAIERLSIVSWSTTQNEIISSLILQREATDSWLCPRLKKLELDGLNPDIALVQRMIDSRLNVPQPAASLKYVRWVCEENSKDESAITMRRSILENSYSCQDISFEFT